MKKKIVAIAALMVCCMVSVAAAQDEEQGRDTIRKRILRKNSRKIEEAPAPDSVKLSPYWIGVEIRDLSETLKAQLQLEHGAVISNLVEDGPAAAAGLQEHDIILQYNNSKIDTVFDLVNAVGKSQDKESKVTILRKGKRETVKVTPTKRPESPEPQNRETDELKIELERALRAGGGGPQRFMIVRPPALAAQAKFPKDLELHATLRAGKHKYEIKLNGKKYTVEGNDFSKLPPEVRQALPFLSGIGIAPRIMMFSDENTPLNFRVFSEKLGKGPLGENIEVEVETTETTDETEETSGKDDVAKQVKELAKQIRELSKEVQSLKEKK